MSVMLVSKATYNCNRHYGQVRICSNFNSQKQQICTRIHVIFTCILTDKTFISIYMRVVNIND